MLDLKAKLLAAGLVTAEQVAKADEERKEQAARAERRAQNREGERPRRPERGPDRGPERKRDRPPPKPALSDDERWQERVKKLAEAPKSEQYEVLRGWVERTRMDDPKALPSDEAQRFHFQKGDGSIGWVTVEPALHQELTEGRAAVVVYMGFNGALHAVVPRPVAIDMHSVRPEWLRALAEFEFELQPIAPPRKRTKKKSGDAVVDEGAGEESATEAAAGDAEAASGEPSIDASGTVTVVEDRPSGEPAA